MRSLTSKLQPVNISRLYYGVLGRVHPKYREQRRLERLVGPAYCWNELVQYQYDILTRLGVRPEHSLLDIGCGALTTGLKLIPYLGRGQYVGVDLRSQPLIEAYRLIAKHALADKNPTLIQSASFGREEIGNRLFDFVWMSQLSYILDDALMSKFFEHAQKRLKPKGRLLLDILGPEQIVAPGTEWHGFNFYSRPLDYYAALAERFGFSMKNRGRIAEFGYPQRIELHTNITGVRWFGGRELISDCSV